MKVDHVRRSSLLVVIGITLLGAGLAFPFSSAMEDVSVTNPAPRGADEFGQMLTWASKRHGSPDVRVWQENLNDIDRDGGQGSLVILGPSTRFSASEVEAITRFARSGGRVFIADDVGVANTLLDPLPTRTRVVGTELIDLAFSRQPQFPVLHSIRPHPLTEGVDALVGNAASAVRADKNASVLIASSDSSWLDADADGLPGPRDRRGPHPILTVERLGRGELVVLSDPSILTNEMLPVAANRFFAENLANYLAAGGLQIHVDETHREHRPFALLAGALPAASDGARYGFLAFGITAVAGVFVGRIVARRFTAWRENRRKEDPDVVETVLTRNPQWSERDLQRLARHLLTGTRSDDRG